MKWFLKYKKIIIVFGILIAFYFFVYVYGNKDNISEEYITKDYVLSRVEKIKSFDKDQNIEVLRIKNSAEIQKISENLKNVSKGDFIIVFDTEYWVYDYYADKIKETIKISR